MNRHNKKILSSMDNNIDLFNKYKHHYFDFIINTKT